MRGEGKVRLEGQRCPHRAPGLAEGAGVLSMTSFGSRAGARARGNAWPGNARPGNAWPGNAWPGNAWPGNAWPGNAWPDNACPGNAWPGAALVLLAIACIWGLAASHWIG